MKNGKSRVMTYAIVAGCAAYLITMAALAGNAVPADDMAFNQHRSVQLNGASCGGLWRVRCDRGAKLKLPVRRARPGDWQVLTAL